MAYAPGKKRSKGHPVRGSAKEQVFELLRELSLADDWDQSELNDGTRLQEDLAFDSLAGIELAVGLDALFSLGPISEQDAQEIETVGQLLAYLRRSGIDL